MAKKRKSEENSVLDGDVDLNEVMDEDDNPEPQPDEEASEVMGDMLPSRNTTQTPPEQWVQDKLERANASALSSLINNDDETSDVDRLRTVEKDSVRDLTLAQQIMLEGLPTSTAGDALKMFKDFFSLKKDVLGISQARAKAQLDNFDLVRGNLIDSTIRTVAASLDETLTELEIADDLKENIMNKLEEKLQGAKVELVET
jgi:hypothetical protein